MLPDPVIGEQVWAYVFNRRGFPDGGIPAQVLRMVSRGKQKGQYEVEARGRVVVLPKESLRRLGDDTETKHGKSAVQPVPVAPETGTP